MSAPREALDLIERFERNMEAYHSGRYNETQVRREFIDPFFTALGWDIDNKQGYAEAYKDVIHEDAIKVGGATKAPDYCFRIGGARKFFLEAKKPSVNIKDDVHPAYQLRRYAWSAKLPLSILTDFEEFAVYDCRVKPSKADKASTARVFYLTYMEYAQRWDEIASIFSRDAVLKGSFDKYAESHRAKRGTAEVDAAFLKDIESWRELLARNIALRNPALSQRELNFAVQRTIDRIIFLRICEDRGIESYGQLMGLRNGTLVYSRLLYLFRRADDRYNSGLFHFRYEKERSEPPDELTLGLVIDDKPLKEIIAGLYYPESPYEFSVLPADILGQVYEQFLGKVIRLTAGHHAKVEDKPEVRKAGGVYYTPTYIVEYIVKHTVGKLLEDKKPGPRGGASKLKILDPACGSGSFLLGAYQELLDWHRDRYLEDGPENHRKELYQGSGGDWRLTTGERKRILLNNIYGVDIDPQAVETTKLSLLLKVLEGQSEETLTAQLRLFRERALPDLAGNIKCGNSLIGPDFYANRQMSLLDEEERYRINVFDWHAEFPDIISSGGFDAVIGNPPYVRIQAMKEWATVEVEHYKKAYISAGKGNYDIYVVFVERALSIINNSGLVGLILPHKFFNAKYGEGLRTAIAAGRYLSHVVHFSDQQVFSPATTYTCLLFLDKRGSDNCHFVKVVDLNTWRSTRQAIEGVILLRSIGSGEWNFVIGNEAELFEKLRVTHLTLGDIANIFVGLQTSADNVFLFKDSDVSASVITKTYSKELNQYVELESELLKPVIRSGKIGRFWAIPTALVLFPYNRVNEKIQLITEIEMRRRFPKTWEYLLANKKFLSEREHGKFKEIGWYQLYPKNLDTWDRQKILLPYMITHLAAYYDEESNYFVNVTTGGFGMTLNELYGTMKYITGLLNSRLLDWFMKKVSTTFHGGYLAANKQFLVQLPIRTINFEDRIDKMYHDKMVLLVDEIQRLHKQLHGAKTGHSGTTLQRQIDASDQQIDRLVYELYGLTEDEIAVVEGRDTP